MGNFYNFMLLSVALCFSLISGIEIYFERLKSFFGV